MVIWVKCTHPVHFSSVIPRMSTFTIAISCLTTSNLPWFVDLTFQVPMQYCSLQHRTLLLSPVASTTGYYFCFGCCPSFFLELFLHWCPVAYWAPTDPESSPFGILSFCLFILFMGSQGKNTEVVCHSLLQRTTFFQTTPPWPVCLAWPLTTWLSFIELDKAVVRVVRLASFLWLWFQCVCSLMPSRNTYHLTWVSIILDVGYLFIAAPAKHSCCSLRGISSRPPLLTLNESSSSQPSSATQPPLLGHAVASPGLCPWLRVWGSSSKPCFWVVHWLL